MPLFPWAKSITMKLKKKIWRAAKASWIFKDGLFVKHLLHHSGSGRRRGINCNGTLSAQREHTSPQSGLVAFHKLFECIDTLVEREWKAFIWSDQLQIILKLLLINVRSTVIWAGLITTPSDIVLIVLSNTDIAIMFSMFVIIIIFM